MNMDSTEHHQLLVRNSLSMALVLVHDACFIIFLETKNQHVETFLSISLLKDETWTKIARYTFFEGRNYFLGNPNTPRPISKDVCGHCARTF